MIFVKTLVQPITISIDAQMLIQKMICGFEKLNEARTKMHTSLFTLLSSLLNSSTCTVRPPSGMLGFCGPIEVIPWIVLLFEIDKRKLK